MRDNITMVHFSQQQMSVILKMYTGKFETTIDFW